MDDAKPEEPAPAGPLDEVALRRPGYRGGEKILLADGQYWSFPKPMISFAPDDTEQGYRVYLELGDGFDARMATMEAAKGGAFIGAQLGVARYLLCLNYDLTLAQVQRLIRFRYEEDAEDATRAAIMDVARGLDAPKPPGDGSASPSG